MQALPLSLLISLLVPVVASAAQNEPTPAQVKSTGPTAPSETNTGSQEANVPPQMQATIVHMRAAFDAQRAQMAVAENLLRAQILEVLTPAQRSFVAATVGKLVVAPAPDAADAARRLDATFSPGQRQAVAGLVNAMQARAQAIFSQMVAQSQSEMVATTSAKDSGAATGGTVQIRAIAAPPLATRVQGGIQMQGAPLPSAAFGGPENQSAGVLVLEILMTGSMGTLHPAPMLVPQK